MRREMYWPDLPRVEVEPPTSDALRGWLVSHPDQVWDEPPAWNNCPLVHLLQEGRTEQVIVRWYPSEWEWAFMDAFDAAMHRRRRLTSADVLVILESVVKEAP